MILSFNKLLIRLIYWAYRLILSFFDFYWFYNWFFTSIGLNLNKADKLSSYKSINQLILYAIKHSTDKINQIVDYLLILLIAHLFYRLIIDFYRFFPLQFCAYLLHPILLQLYYLSRPSAFHFTHSFQLVGFYREKYRIFGNLNLSILLISREFFDIFKTLYTFWVQ